MSEGAEDQTQISGLCAWVDHGIIRQNKSPGGAGAGEWAGWRGEDEDFELGHVEFDVSV